MTALRWKSSSTRSKPNSSITSIMQHVRKPSVISLLTSKASTIERGAIPPSVTSARSRWSSKQLNPVHFFGGRSQHEGRASGGLYFDDCYRGFSFSRVQTHYIHHTRAAMRQTEAK